MTRLISNASPEQLEKAEQLKAEAEQKRIEAETEKNAKAEAKAKQDAEAIEGEFTEIKEPTPTAPEPETTKQPQQEEPELRPEQSPIEIMQETISELEQYNASLVEEIDSITKVFESDDRLAAAHAEIKRLQEQNRALKESRNGSMNTENQAKKLAKYWKAKFEKLAKEVESAKN